MFCLHFDWLLGIFPPNFPPHFPPFVCVFHCLTESRHNRNQSNKWPKQVGKKSNLLDLYRIGYKSNLLDFSRVELRLSRVERRQRHFLPVCACHTQTETETETQVSRRRLHLTRCGHVAVVAVAVVAAHLHAGYLLPLYVPPPLGSSCLTQFISFACQRAGNKSNSNAFAIGRRDLLKLSQAPAYMHGYPIYIENN